MSGKHFINNKWKAGDGQVFSSENPATGEVIWQGNHGTEEDVKAAITAARDAFYAWGKLGIKERISFLQQFCEILKEQKIVLTETLSKETGKPLWEAETEISAMLAKLPISIQAYSERCKEIIRDTPAGRLVTRHKPHGVLVVFGPFNLPAHLPNSHIIPALLAGNAVVFKPSELTPLVAEKIIECWEQARLPAGVINLLQGAAETGESLCSNPDINGLLFTGSFRTGQILAKQFAMYPEKILALEMGGNNPLVVCGIKDNQAAAYQVVQSAYLTAGQRCTCARRLILTREKNNEIFLETLIPLIEAIKVGHYTERPEPFMGPVINNAAAEKILAAQNSLINLGAKSLVALKRVENTLPFLSPGLIDVTEVQQKSDEEIFGPLLQLVWVDDLKAAIEEANRTAYGLAAGILTTDETQYLQFRDNIRAGVINWNRATTGASSGAPFGGVGHSGNYRPSAYYAADYCAYPVAGLVEKTLELPKILSPGIQL